MVGRIKAGGSETRILVADKECVEWHLEHKQTISSSLPYVVHLSSQRSTSPVPSSSSSSSLSAEEEAAQRENPTAPVQPIVEELQDLRDEMVSGNYKSISSGKAAMTHTEVHESYLLDQIRESKRT